MHLSWQGERKSYLIFFLDWFWKRDLTHKFSNNLSYMLTIWKSSLDIFQIKKKDINEMI